MKARLPKGYGNGGANNIQQLARQAQKLQDDMEAASAELEAKEYDATAGGGAVKVTVTGKMELTKVEISPEVVDPEDVEMLSDLVIEPFHPRILLTITSLHSLRPQRHSIRSVPTPLQNTTSHTEPSY